MPARATIHSCVVPGCSRPGLNQLGVRCRFAYAGRSPSFPDKRRTDAIFSVESSAYLCDSHATLGGRVELTFTPDRSRTVTVVAQSGGNVVVARTKEIAQPAAEAA
jgi:hypothetical protein